MVNFKSILGAVSLLGVVASASVIDVQASIASVVTPCLTKSLADKDSDSNSSFYAELRTVRGPIGYDGNYLKTYHADDKSEEHWPAVWHFERQDDGKYRIGHTMPVPALRKNYINYGDPANVDTSSINLDIRTYKGRFYEGGVEDKYDFIIFISYYNQNCIWFNDRDQGGFTYYASCTPIFVKKVPEPEIGEL